MPPEFVATRNELVKALRRERRREEATALAALRRPGWDDWALNAAARSDGDVVAAFAAAAADVREAQAAAIEGRDGPDIRGALRDLRDRSAELVRHAEDALRAAGRQPVTGEISARLAQVATNELAVAQLLAGILGSGDTAPTDLFAAFGGAAPASGSTSERGSSKRATASRARRPTAAAPAGSGTRAPDEPDPEQQRREQERQEQEARAQRHAELEAAIRRLDEAVARHERAAAQAADAREALERARAALAEADAAAAAADADLASATAALEEASGQLDAARLAAEGSG